MGHRIKIRPALILDKKEGLYIISVSDGSEIEFSTQISNTPTELIYQAPAQIASGKYKMEVRTYYNGSGVSKNLKTIRFDAVFTVS